MDGACIVTSIGSPPPWATSLNWLFVVSLKLLFGDTWFLCTDSCLGIPFLATRTPLFVLFELARIFVRLPPIEGAWIVTSICPPPLWETSLKWLVPWPLWFGKVVSCTIASYAGGGDIGAARLAGTDPGGSASYAGGAIGPSSGRGSAIHKRMMNRDWKVRQNLTSSTSSLANGFRSTPRSGGAEWTKSSGKQRCTLYMAHRHIFIHRAVRNFHFQCQYLTS